MPKRYTGRELIKLVKTVRLGDEDMQESFSNTTEEYAMELSKGWYSET